MSQVERENTERFLKLEKSSDNIPFSHSEVGVSEKNDTWLSFVWKSPIVILFLSDMC